MSNLAFPAIIPIRGATEPELAAAARASWTLQAARRLADWFGDDPVNAESGYHSASAQRDAAIALGLVTSSEAITAETASRLSWIYEVAFHAGYLQARHDRRGTLSRAAALSGDAERTDAEMIADWARALDALIAHGLEHAMPPGTSPAPLDFNGAGSFPVLRLLEQRGTATAAMLSADVAEGVMEPMTPSYRRQRWAEWTAGHGDPTAAFLSLAAEFGLVTVDGPAITLTPLATWALSREVGAEVELLPPSAELTPLQVIICRLGMSDEAFEQELHPWLAAREPTAAVSGLLTTAAGDHGPAYLTTGVQIAAGIAGDTAPAWLEAMSLPAIRPYAVTELNRRAGRDPQHDPLPGLEPLGCDAVVMASNAILTGNAIVGPAGVAQAVREAAAPEPETVLFDQMWRSRHVIADQALLVIGKLHPDKKIAKAARAALVKAASARNSKRSLS